MTHLVATILGFIEGATEFIPVSSSGHLIIAREILGQNNVGGLAFDAVLQFSATFALIVYFWRDILKLIGTFFSWISGKEVSKNEKVILSSIVIGTIPGVLFGLILEKDMETIFRDVHLVALTLILGSILFLYAQRVGKQDKQLSVWKGIMIGLFQCFALVPGISRSGATISGGLIAGLNKDEAVRFSFLLSIPILLGSGLKKLFEIRHELFTTGYGSSLLLGSAVSFVVAFISITFLIKYLKTHNLNSFVIYRIALSIAIFLVF